jgi:hypothetical protein
VTLKLPVPATEENVRAATTFDTRDELIARLQHVELPTSADIQHFAAEWRAISLTRDRRLHLDAGDCDLMQGVRDQIFAKVAIRVTRGHLGCTSGIATRTRPTFEVEALVAASPATLASAVP